MADEADRGVVDGCDGRTDADAADERTDAEATVGRTDADVTGTDAVDPSDGIAVDAGGDDDGSVPGTGDPDVEFGWRGWVLVGGVVLSFLVIPWAIIYLPAAQGLLSSLGLGLRDAYLVLPLVPAVGLATLAVWSAVAHRREADRE